MSSNIRKLNSIHGSNSCAMRNCKLNFSNKWCNSPWTVILLLHGHEWHQFSLDHKIVSGNCNKTAVTGGTAFSFYSNQCNLSNIYLRITSRCLIVGCTINAFNVDFSNLKQTLGMLSRWHFLATLTWNPINWTFCIRLLAAQQ